MVLERGVRGSVASRGPADLGGRLRLWLIPGRAVAVLSTMARVRSEECILESKILDTLRETNNGRKEDECPGKK